MMQTNTVYDKKWLIWCTVGLVAMSAAMKASGGIAFALIFPMILVGFSKHRTEFLLYCLLMTIAITMSNDKLVPKGLSFGLMARAVHVILACVMTLQLVGQRSSRLISPLLAVVPYLAYMAIVSSMGWMPLISYLKLVLFTTVFLGFYGVANAVAQRQAVDSRKLRSVVLAFAIYYLVGSVVLIPFPGISVMSAEAFFQKNGYLPDGVLFMGMTTQAQALGPIVASLSVILLSDLLFSVQRFEKFYLGLLLCCPILIYKTGSRTAMGSYLAGICLSTFLLMQAHGRTIGPRWKQRSLSLLMMIGLIGGTLLMVSPGVRESVARFVLKYTADTSELNVSWDAVTATRQGAVESQMENIRESPWVGHGFQVSRSMMGLEIISWKQLLSAPIEKGVWVTAVLEEGGIFGMALFVVFLLYVVIVMWQRKAYVGLSAFVTLVVSNLGEFTIFSMTSIGGFMWALVFVGLALDAHRHRMSRVGESWSSVSRSYPWRS